MRKKKAVLLFGSLLAMLIGYVAWCLRVYYVSPHIEWEEGIGAEERRELQPWIAANLDEFEMRPQWSWSGARHRLTHPYDGSVGELWVLRTGGGFYVRNDWSGFVQYVELRVESGDWVARVLTYEQSEYVEMMREE